MTTEEIADYSNSNLLNKVEKIKAEELFAVIKSGAITSDEAIEMLISSMKSQASVGSSPYRL